MGGGLWLAGLAGRGGTTVNSRLILGLGGLMGRVMSGAVWVVLGAGVLAGCASEPLVIEPAAIVETSSTDRDLPLRPWVPPAAGGPGVAGVPGPMDAVTLDVAVDRAIRHSPAVQAAFFEIEAKRGEAAQASYRPNPELALDVENFLGSKANSGFDAAEETLSLSQTIELGDKRLMRLRAAHLDTSAAAWDFEAARVAAGMRAADAFIDVLICQMRIDVMSRFVGVTEKTLQAVDKQISGGSAVAVDRDRAKIAVAKAEAALATEKARHASARRSLSVLWGSERPLFERASGTVSGGGVPSLESIRSHIEQHPALARWGDEIARRAAVVDVERSKAIPDVTVGMGVRRFNENDSGALVASVSMPLQVFGGNQGSIAAAEQRLQKADFEQAAARGDLMGTLVEAHGALSVAATQRDYQASRVMPAARSAFDRSKAAFEQGKIDLMGLLDSQRSLTEAELEMVGAEAEAAKWRIKLEMLVGAKLDTLGK